MCLSTVYSKKKREELIAKHQKNGFITVYKVFCKIAPAIYRPWLYNYKFHSGKNTTKGRKLFEYRAAFHSFLSKWGAKHWRYGNSNEKIICCRVPIKSITAIGLQGGYRSIVSAEIICPKYFGKRKR